MATAEIEEPWARLEIITRDSYIGSIMQLVVERRGSYITTEYLKKSSLFDARGDLVKRVILHFSLPLSELLTDFYDKLKSVSSGYASLNYDFFEMRSVELFKVTFLVADEEKESLTLLVPKNEAYERARGVLATLQREIPPHLFEIRLQAKVGGKIIASERIRAMRKDVTAKLYGGDVTRKMKLLKKQKKGKMKMATIGRVDIPHSAYLAVLKR
jgi:GTP-binding protein LepA